LIDIIADGLNTNLDLPVTINELPSSVDSSNCIEIIPLKAGTTAKLLYKWELPFQTDNDAQGDSLSFTINYLLEECAVTDLTGVVNPDGSFTEMVTAQSLDNKNKITINKDTIGKDKDNQPLSEIWLIKLNKEMPPPPPDKKIIGFCFDAGPDGATFDQPITLTFSYDPGNIPAGVNENELAIALWDKNTNKWIKLEGCIVNIGNHTISALITHFSRYTIISPEHGVYSEEPNVPAQKEETASPKLLEVDILGKTENVEIGTDGSLAQPLIMTDNTDNFMINISSGTVIRGIGDIEISRIVLRKTSERIPVSDNMIILSPVYELIGYTNSMQQVKIHFEPAPILIIKYNPEDMAENTFLPYIASYSSEQGLVQLQLMPDAPIEIGEAMAVINDASLFVIVAEIAAPAPLLPVEITASNLMINPTQISKGQPVNISLTLTNENPAEGNFELHLIIDGIVRLIREVTLAGNSSETLTFEIANLAVGNHLVEIGGLTEQFKIERITTIPGEGEVNWLLIDLSVGIAIVIGAFILYFVIRRQRREQGE
ncbi:MAG: hypothetical protein PHQ86_06910, partial [Dehalococcoidales bacterium]|nr:hypothetical protein [Dehalococcoidales bacterium]